ncbi:MULTISPECIES: bacterioferritin-associated ferredoxin [Pseudovibrio]|uniref:(2Fe-2S)-binding protein n=1 Tax=Stappiaceae TaxID=2821832 RepID=UPI002365524B|nr:MULTISPECIES: (2Fe-2S)-binding protein [Pseudovibrio]MDD7910047.1 (2Fe-2S)-binding protein [Pseudovibrio exalbescens]MDX5592330.1 (2Fe-2S)-binding protein [Pseudovibrio sp. SPO723]
MIVCHCNVINDDDLRQAAEELQGGPNGSLPTPGALFRKLGHRPNCGGCFPRVIDVVYALENKEDVESGQ